VYPEHLKEQYCDEVATLVSKAKVGDNGTVPDDESIRRTISAFRDRLASHEAGDLIYHQQAIVTAAAIRSVISKGLPDVEQIRTDAERFKKRTKTKRTA
jgi:hypothetical protein